jgi:nucleoside-diphosphate-sugar epimerase
MVDELHQVRQPPAYLPGIAADDLQLILDKTPSNVWETLRGQRIFITGGTGFIGCWLLEAFIWADIQLRLGLNLTVLSRNPDAFRIKAPHLAEAGIVRLVKGNVTDLQGIDEPFDTVIHAATDVVKPAADPVVVFDDIVKGAKESLSLARRSQARRYLLTSSGAVYGPQPSEVAHLPESYLGAPDTTQPNTAYGEGKRVSEWLAQCHGKQYGIDTKIARCFALIGPYLPLDAHFAAGNFIKDALRGQTIKISGDGTPYRSYLYGADMTVWLLTILVNGANGQPYNVGSDRGVSIRALAQTVSRIIRGTTDIEIGAQAVANSPVQRYVPNIDRAIEELRVLEYTDLESAIRKTVDWETEKQPSPARHLSGSSHA